MQACAQEKVVHTSTGILLEYCWNTTSNNKNEQTVSTQNGMYESQKRYADKKKPVTKEYILYDSIHMMIEIRIMVTSGVLGID